MSEQSFIIRAMSKSSDGVAARRRALERHTGVVIHAPDQRRALLVFARNLGIENPRIQWCSWKQYIGERKSPEIRWQHDDGQPRDDIRVWSLLTPEARYEAKDL